MITYNYRISITSQMYKISILIRNNKYKTHGVSQYYILIISSQPPILTYQFCLLFNGRLEFNCSMFWFWCQLRLRALLKGTWAYNIYKCLNMTSSYHFIYWSNRKLISYSIKKIIIKQISYSWRIIGKKTKRLTNIL